jgi:pilus assembly protein CpaB
MKPARLIVLGVALAAGGFAAYLASGSRPSAPPPAPPAPPPLATVDVLTAKNDLNVGQTIGEPDVVWQSWPAAAANANFIKKSDRPDAIKQFAGAMVRAQVLQGEPIRESKVIIGKRSGYLAAVLPAGIRAVSLDVAPDTDAGGFILPNDRVDVLLTRRDRSGEGAAAAVEKFVTETILRNVQVLAIDQTIAEKDGEKVVVGKTATIALTPDQAERLALAHQLGSLSLALRSVADSQSPHPEDGVPKKAEDHAINMVRFGIGAHTAATQ